MTGEMRQGHPEGLPPTQFSRIDNKCPDAARPRESGSPQSVHSDRNTEEP